jgi:alpha-D-xyloside xylohydrolase
MSVNSRTMKLRTYGIVVLFLLASLSTEAQHFQKTPYGIKSVINSIEVAIRFYNPSTVRVLKSAQGEPYSKQTLSVIDTPQNVAPKVEQFGDELALSREY